MSGSDNQSSGGNRQGSRRQAQGGGQQANPQGHQGQQGQRGGQGGGTGQQQFSGGGQGAPQPAGQGGQQGYRGPPGGGGGYGSAGGLGSPVGQKYLTGIAGSLLVLGVALGLMVVFVASISGPTMVEDPDEDLTDEEQEQLEERQEDSFLASHVQLGTHAGPYVAFVVVALLGLLAGANLPGTLKDKAAVAVVGAAIGTVLFVGASDVILSTQYPEATEENLVTEHSLEFANVATTAIATAVVAALVSAVGVVLGDQIDAAGGSL